MKSTGKKTLDTKSTSKNKQRQSKKSGTPIIERDHSFSDNHQERHNRAIGIDHEPGVI